MLRLSARSVLIKDADMSKYCSVRAGGRADFLLDAGSIEDIVSAVNFCEGQIPYRFIGRGSNLLVRDCGYKGMLIRVAKPLSPLRIEGESVLVSAGEALRYVSLMVADFALSGLEFAAGIPGSMGGAIVMNAGAHGGQMQDCVTAVQILSAGELVWVDAARCGFGYRQSAFFGREDAAIISSKLLLKKGDIGAIRGHMAECLAWRGKYQPKGFPNAGSAFKRLKQASAGELIDKWGLKGKRIGGAEVSNIHANFLINTGGATASDFIMLMEYIETVAYENGVTLEREIEVIGG